MYLQRKLLVTLKLGALLRAERSFLQYYSRKWIVCIRVSTPLRKTTPVFHQAPEGEKCNPPLPPCKKSHSSFPATSSKNWDLVKPPPLFFFWKFGRRLNPPPSKRGGCTLWNGLSKLYLLAPCIEEINFFMDRMPFLTCICGFAKGLYY